MSIRKVGKLSLIAACFLFSGVSSAGLFKIEINDVGGLSGTQSAIFTDVANLWETFLIGVQSVNDLTLTINAKGDAIDGVNGVLGSAGPTVATIDNAVGFAYATHGDMRFDTADLGALESNGSLFSVIFHEVAHVIGFGSLWNTSLFGGAFSGTQNVYTNGTGQYTGAYALDVYRNEFDAAALYVPVELDGGAGTANAHWAESWAGGSGDIMTGYLESVTALSRTTIASFADIGYLTSVTHGAAIEDVTTVPEPAALGLLSLGLFMMFRRNRKI